MPNRLPPIPRFVHQELPLLDTAHVGQILATVENIRGSLDLVGLTFADLARSLPPPASALEIIEHNFERNRRGLADTRDLCPIEMIVRLQRDAALSSVEAVFVRRLARRLRGSKPLSLNQVELLRDLYREQFA